MQDSAVYNPKIKGGANWEKSFMLGLGRDNKISFFADAGSGTVIVTTVYAHGLDDGDRVQTYTLSDGNGVDYTGAYTVAGKTDTTFNIEATWHGDYAGSIEPFWMTPYDFTGHTGGGAFKAGYGFLFSELADPAVTFPDATGGIYNVALSVENTRAIEAGCVAGLDNPQTDQLLIPYEVEAVDGSGNVISLLNGLASIIREVD